MTPQLQKFKDAGVDVVFTYALAPELAQVLKSADKIGYKPVIVGSWTWGQPLLVKLAGEDLVKKYEIYFIQSFTPDRDATAAAFDKRVIQETGDDPVPITAAQGYDATRLILMALDKVGPDPKAIRDAIEATTGFTPVTTAGTTPYSKDKHEAIDAKDMFVATYDMVDGKLKIVKAK